MLIIYFFILLLSPSFAMGNGLSFLTKYFYKYADENNNNDADYVLLDKEFSDIDEVITL